ncbi:MAG: DUF167 domain-containing protein [Actinomycetota bacterium]|nr:DUF167 domain-containing protein [Actinomycetota bacterium]
MLTLRVSPGAKRSSVEGTYGRRALKLKIAAPPVGGKANAETERFLAKLLGVSRSEVSVEKEARSRDKVVLLRGIEPGEVARVLEGHIRWVRCP